MSGVKYNKYFAMEARHIDRVLYGWRIRIRSDSIVKIIVYLFITVGVTRPSQ